MNLQSDNEKLEVSEENMLWIKDCSQILNTSPAVFLNALLNFIKSENGLISKNLQSWIEENKETKKTLSETLQKLEETRVLVEETTRATKLYIHQIFQETQKTQNPNTERKS
jgi:F0F1-type ATP synthase membrane subunit b/b'